MQNQLSCKRIRSGIQLAIILLFCVATVLFDFVSIGYSSNPLHRRFFTKIVQQTCGSVAAILLLRRLEIRLFGQVKNLLYLLPCLLIAVDNFQFVAYFNGKMQLLHTATADILLFIGYCLSIGLFEELVFRGILFSVIAGFFSRDKKGFLWTYVISSAVFGLAHLFNGFSPAVFLQVGYTVLTGGLFAFCLVKTKNILLCAFVHGLYNFCGLLFDAQGLGAGVAFDVGTAITMAIVSVCVGVFVLYKVFKYSEEERKELYEYLNVSEK